MAAFVFVYLAALAALFVSAFWSVDPFTSEIVRNWGWSNFSQLIHTAVYRRIAFRTVGIAAAVTVTDALLAFPALVLASYLFSTHLTFSLAPVYIGAMALTAISVWQITGDGEAQPFEGLALIAIYVVLAAFTLYD